MFLELLEKLPGFDRRAVLICQHNASTHQRQEKQDVFGDIIESIVASHWMPRCHLLMIHVYTRQYGCDPLRYLQPNEGGGGRNRNVTWAPVKMKG